MIKWQGTQVPNSGTIEKIYVNTNLSKEEVIDIISKIDYTINEPALYFEYPVAVSTDAIPYLVIQNFDDFEIYGTYIGTIFTSADGWSADFNGEIEVNKEVVENTTAEYWGYEDAIVSGTQNNLLTELFSITPFVVVNPTADKLQKLIDGKQYVIDKTNAKAGSDLKIDSTWQSIGDIIEELETTPSLQEKTTTPNKTPQTIIPDEGYDGLSKVFVNPIPDNYIEPNGTISITSNGTHDVFGYKNANVNVPSEASRIIASRTWQGTQVPNTGLVENVYFNTNLSVEETVNLLSQLNYTTSRFIDIPIYGLLYKHTWINNEWVDLILSVFKFDDLNYAIVDFDNQLFYFVTENVPDMPLDFVGWNPSLSSEIIINGDVSDSLQDISFGTQNNLLTELFSITPFTQGEGEAITLSGDYDGSSVEITDLSAKEGTWKGIQVPNTGYINTIYFNDNLEPKEILNLFSQLTYIETPFVSSPIYPILFSNDGSQVLFILKDQDGDGNIYYEIYDTNIADTSTAKRMVYLNTKDLTLEINYTTYGILQSVINEYSGLAIGTQNDILSSFIAISTFSLDQSRMNVIDIKQYIDKNKIPLELKINTPQALGIKLMPTITGSNGVACTYKFDGIYTGNYANSNITFNEELTKMVMSFTSYLSVDTENQSVIMSYPMTYFRYEKYKIEEGVEFPASGAIRNNEVLGKTWHGYYRTLYIPIELWKIIQDGKYISVQAHFTYITPPTGDATCYSIRPENFEVIDDFAFYPTGNYLGMQVTQGHCAKDDTGFSIQLYLWTD